MIDRKEILNRISQLMEEKGVSDYKLKQNADVSTTINQWRKNPTREKIEFRRYALLIKYANFLTYHYHTFSHLITMNNETFA